jgi:hypothetical protein
MSEEKVIQHSQKAVDLLRNKSKTIKEKILGFLEEIVIIIIAVSLTLAFHNWNDRRNEREIERNFLAGIKQDLLNDAENIQEGIKQFQPTVAYYDTVWRQLNGHKIDTAVINAGSGALINTSYFGFDGSRFEGFKSSGYLRLISNEKLLKDLMLLYSTDLPFEREADITVFHKRMDDFDQYIGTRVPIDSAGTIHLSRLLNDPALRFQIFYYRLYLRERQERKAAIVKEMRSVADEIDIELNK